MGYHLRGDKPPHLSISPDMLATAPTGANRDLIREVADDLGQDADWAEVLEVLRERGHSVPAGEVIGAMQGL